MRSVVVLPQPLAPITEKNEPLGRLRLTPSTAVTPLNRLETFASRTLIALAVERENAVRARRPTDPQAASESTAEVSRVIVNSMISTPIALISGVI